MNIALMSKWWWMLILCPNEMLQELLKDKYRYRIGSWNTKLRNNSNISSFWRNMCSIEDIFWQGVSFIIGKQSQVVFWH